MSCKQYLKKITAFGVFWLDFVRIIQYVDASKNSVVVKDIVWGLKK